MFHSVRPDPSFVIHPHDDGHTEILFTPLVPFETAEALDKICHEYNCILGNFEVEPLIAIPIFIHDFLCIHPFNDGNGRMSRLLTTLLLYRSGFYVGKYISLEALIAQNKAAYYEALRKAGQHWHEEKEDVLLFCSEPSLQPTKPSKSDLPSSKKNFLL
ncbi:Fic family protein [uncultured Streptococcus sp.]|uniref:Fic family protein n=1 Tax=uncultured Streptococcus sp. TaxID=83427 RepID=UPI00259B63FC|nr:Fic family protein [uncultured Streptococcus sp.]